MCRNWKAWAVIAALALAVVVAAPDARATVVPFVLVAACPLSMVLMALGMARQPRAASDRGHDETAPPVAPR